MFGLLCSEKGRCYNSRLSENSHPVGSLANRHFRFGTHAQPHIYAHAAFVRYAADMLLCNLWLLNKVNYNSSLHSHQM